MIAGQPNRGVKDQKAVFASADAIGKIGQVRISAFDRLDTDTDRVIYIGESLKIHGDKWKEKNENKMLWLESKGETQASAIKKFEAWKAEQTKNPFWSEMYDERKRKAEKKKPIRKIKTKRKTRTRTGAERQN